MVALCNLQDLSFLTSDQTWALAAKVLTMESQKIPQSPVLVRGTPNEQQINTECASGHDWCREKHKAEDDDKENGGWVGSDTMVS